MAPPLHHDMLHCLMAQVRQGKPVHNIGRFSIYTASSRFCHFLHQQSKKPLVGFQSELLIQSIDAFLSWLFHPSADKWPHRHCTVRLSRYSMTYHCFLYSFANSKSSCSNAIPRAVRNNSKNRANNFISRSITVSGSFIILLTSIYNSWYNLIVLAYLRYT